jgi:hypothetical protein
MRPLALSACLAVLVSTNLLAGTVQIREVGLQGYYATEPTPARVEVLLTNPEPKPQAIALRFRIIDLSTEAPHPPNQFSLSVNLGPGESRTVAVPVLIFFSTQLALEVEARDAAGKLIGQDRRPLEPPLTEHLMAIVCAEQAVCQAAQSEISFSGNANEQTLKGKSLKFVWVRQPPENWWAYSVAETIVAAAPLDEMSATRLSALADSFRHGQRLILIEDQIHDSAFLAPYRQGPANDEPQVVGKGLLFRVGKLAGSELGQLFSGDSLSNFLAKIGWSRFQTDELSWIVRRLATSFRFPRLGWLLLWLGAYILIIGLFNFALLRRLGKREWGWVTVPAVAVLFSVALYAWSASRRPGEFGADELAVYWMDEQSPLAASRMDLRVSAPRRATVPVVIPQEVVFNGRSEPFSFGFAELTNEAMRGGWDVHFGPPWHLDLPLLQWSFQDLRFSGMKRFPGTVRRVSETKLRNETGQSFSQAIYVDKRKVYFLGAVAPGAEMDLSAVRQKPLAAESGRTFPYALGYPATLGNKTPPEQVARQFNAEKYRKEMSEWRQLPNHPFDLVELIRGWPGDGGQAFNARSGVFFGLSEEPVLQAALRGVRFSRKNYALTIVSFGRTR